MREYNCRTLPCLRALAAAGWVGAAATVTALEPGDSLADVEREFGPPQNYLFLGSRSVLHYDEGRIELRDGAVTAIELRGPAEVERVRTERESLRRQQHERAVAAAASAIEPAPEPGPEEAPVAAGVRQEAREIDAGIDQAQLEAEARLNALARRAEESERRADAAALDALLARLEQQAAPAPAPPAQTTVIVNEIVNQVNVVTDTAPRRHRKTPETKPRPPNKPLERYSIDRRLGPMDGQPEFGGRI